jgi:hypothetical protein
MDNNWPPKEWTDQELQDFASTYQPLDLDQLAEKLRNAANSADKIERARIIIDEACKKNGGLPF